MLPIMWIGGHSNREANRNLGGDKVNNISNHIIFHYYWLATTVGECRSGVDLSGVNNISNRMIFHFYRLATTMRMSIRSWFSFSDWPVPPAIIWRVSAHRSKTGQNGTISSVRYWVDDRTNWHSVFPSQTEQFCYTGWLMWLYNGLRILVTAYPNLQNLLM